MSGKTLYVSDLDGTLLRQDDSVSPFTAEVIRRLVEGGGAFTYATARSLTSASVVTEGLPTKLPVIIYNGAFIRRADTGEDLLRNAFTPEQTRRVETFLRGLSIFPLVYAFREGRERVSWDRTAVNEGMLRYIGNRKVDNRLNPLPDSSTLYEGECFYFTCIGEKEELEPVFAYFSAQADFRCNLQQELYRPEYWCEIMPEQVSKRHAALQLKALLGCDRMIGFGDTLNDIPLFEACDEAYAVENASPELKALATALIPSNQEDGVAKWLLANAEELRR